MVRDIVLHTLLNINQSLFFLLMPSVGIGVTLLFVGVPLLLLVVVAFLDGESPGQ